jgi:non-lysosomal glucosylceramidase
MFSWPIKVESGVPLGGIGAGKVEINSKGKMVNLTIANNRSAPTPWMRGFHVLVRPDDSEPFFMESGLPMKNFSKYEPESMSYTGRYPFATLTAKKGNVEATMEVFSPMIPHNLTDSSMPVFGISIRVKGSKGGIVVVGTSNIAGTYTNGRINKDVPGGVVFTNPKAGEHDGAKGDLCLLAAEASDKVVQYNINVRPGVALREKHWKHTFESHQPWLSIINGEEPADEPHEVRGDWDDPGAAVISRYGPETETKFVFSWYYTGRWILYPYGHYYHTKFSGAEEVARYVLGEFTRLRDQSRAWHDTLIRRDLPEWLRDAIINSTYTLSSASVLDEQGRFALIESTKFDPYYGTIAGLCHETGSLPLFKMFPELEKNFLVLLASKARDDGYIPHDLGINSFDHPTDGTTSPPGWKDLAPSFILLVYRYYLWMDDLQFLREMYPTLVRGLEWTIKQDTDGDGIPDLVGDGDGGFDATSITGRDSYVGSVFVASLIAMREIDRALDKPEEAEGISKLLSKARESFSALYNGRYFEAWTGEPNPKGYLNMAQVAGDWWTNILGLEPIADKEKLESAYDQLFRVNAQASKFCTPNMVNEDGKIWEMSCQTWSSWPRMVFALAAVRCRAGDGRWLEAAKKEWDNLVAHGLVWDQPSRIDGRTGKADPEMTYLDHYIGSAAIWTFNL